MKLATVASSKRILVVDDDQDLLNFVFATLSSEGYQVKLASSGQMALESLRDWKPDLVILDVNMPVLNGLETLKRIKSTTFYTAIIFLTAESKTEQVIVGLDAGADDYISKPFSPNELLARVRAQLRIKDLTDQLQIANEKLQALVEIDDLTGLFNMRNIYSKLDYEIKRAQRYSRHIAVVMMDMDHFKKVNDQNDHLFGSFVLKEVGGIIKKSIRDTDIGARYGGDEFIIILTETDNEGVRTFCERLRQTIANYNFTNSGSSMRLTSSLGYAIAKPVNQLLDARSLVKWADKALYDSKSAGRNRVCSYDLSNITNLEDDGSFVSHKADAFKKGA
jgi:two-component system, cell cycle response regulator